MLLGTYQAFPMKNGEPCDFDEVERDFNEQLGFAPVWFFPITSMKDFYLQSISTAPNAPQVLMVIDTDKYVRINKIKHYQNLKMNNSDLSDAIDPDVENRYAEFCVDPKEVVREGVIKIMVFLVGIERFLNGESVSSIFPGMDKVPMDVQGELRKYCRMIPEPRIEMPSDASMGTDEFALRSKCEYFKLLFESVFLPFAYNFANRLPIQTYYLEACSRNYMQLNAYKNMFSMWSYEDCSKEGFDKIYEEAKPYIIDNDELLIAIWQNNLPGRNDTCLCGSGMKYKKCCGRYIK